MDNMKKYNQFVESLPNKTVVFAFGRFNPPHIGHGLLTKVVKDIGKRERCDHAIYVSKTNDAKKNPLPVDKKVKYLNLMFPRTNFVAASGTVATLIHAAQVLNKKYNSLIMVAGSDRVADYTRLLNAYNGKDYNFNSIKVVSAGERDPDADSVSGMSASKMRLAAVEGDLETFKLGMPNTIRELDIKRLMNDVRVGMKLEPIKEQFILPQDELRGSYIAGDIFNIGDIVESGDERFEVVKRGSNHILVRDSEGELVSKWLHETKPIQENSNALELARVIASMLGVNKVEQETNPTKLINQALSGAKNKNFDSSARKVLKDLLDLAKEVGIKHDATKLTESEVVDKKKTYNIAKDKLRLSDYVKLKAVQDTKPGSTLDTDDTRRTMKLSTMSEQQEETVDNAVDMAEYEEEYFSNLETMEFTDEELDEMLRNINDFDDIMDAYEEDELEIVDEETGELIPASPEEERLEESALMEVMSRMERMRARMRMRKTKAKRERKMKIAMKRRSDSKTLNRRARRLAVKALKTRFLQGRDPNKLSVGEKERIERIVQSRKKILSRLAIRLVPKVRQIEKARLGSRQSIPKTTPMISR